MAPISPVLGEEFQDLEITFAKSQPEYIPLPSMRSPEGIVLSRWQPTAEERAMIAAGADLHLFIWCGNDPLQPVRVEVMEHDRCLLDTAKFMGLIPETIQPDPKG